MGRIISLFVLSFLFLFHADSSGKEHSHSLLSKTDSQKNNFTSDETETIETTITPHRKNGLFDLKHPVKYDVTLANHYKEKQEGKISFEVRTAQGGIVGISQTDFKINAGAKKTVQWNIPIEDPGFYDIYVRINLTDYDDTIRRVFGYRPYEISTTLHKPNDFDAFWQKAKEDLNAVNPDYRITPDDILSTPTHQVYLVEMNSLDNVKIYGWLTIPRAKGKYPVLYGLGGYKVEMKPLFFDDFAHFTINVRGIGESNHAINPDNQEILTLHLEDKNKYVYRGIYMDCVRGMDFILANEKMGLDISRIGLFGGSQGGTLTWVVAGLTKKAIFCVLDNPTFCDFHTSFDIGVNRQQPEAGFIIKFLKEFLRKNNSIPKEKMLTTLSYFEAQNFMSEVKCPCLVGIGLLDLMAPPTCTLSTFNRLSPELKKASELFSFPELAHEVPMEHNTFKSTWFYEGAVKKLSK